MVSQNVGAVNLCASLSLTHFETCLHDDGTMSGLFGGAVADQ